MWGKPTILLSKTTNVWRKTSVDLIEKCFIISSRDNKNLLLHFSDKLMVKRIASSDSEVKINKDDSFRRANKRQLGLRVRDEFAEALKMQGLIADEPAERILDEILSKHFNQNSETALFLDKAREILIIKQAKKTQ